MAAATTDTTPQESETQQGMLTSTAFVLNDLTLYTSDGMAITGTSYDSGMKAFTLEIDLHQSLFSPVMSGVMSIVDGIDLIAKYGIHGNEWITMSISKAGATGTPPISKTFRVYKISDYNPGLQAASYKMHLISEEMILSNQTFVSKSYKGMLISDMIKDVCQKYLGLVDKAQTNKLKYIEQTKGIFDIIIPRLEPFEAIQWLSTRAYSDTGTLFLFYETSKGYLFTSYETLVTVGKSQPYNTYYIRKPKTDTNPANNYNSITYANFDVMHDILASGKDGAYEYAVAITDILARSTSTALITAKNYKLLLNDNIPVNDAPGRFGNALADSKSDYVLKHIPVMDFDKTVNPMNPAAWLAPSFGRVALLNTVRFTITVPGDTELIPGHVVNLQIPQQTPQSDNYVLNTTRSGNYLVSEVHHRFIMTNTPVFSTVLTLNADSITGQLPAPLPSSPAIQQVLNS